MIRICHLADVHLGYRKYSKVTKQGANQREVDVVVAFREVIDRLVAIRPQITLIAGDLFHLVRPSNAIVTFAFRELRRLATQTGSPIVIVAGNHETPKRSDSGCILRLFTEIPGVFIADSGIENFTFDDLSLCVTAVPHAALERLDSSKLRADDRYKFNVLLTHGQFNEKWLSDFGGIDLPLQSLQPHEWDYIALGHVHVPRQVCLNGWYSGSIEHTAHNIWGERSEGKGFLEVGLQAKQASPKIIFHTLKSPREVLSLDAIDGSAMDPEMLGQSILASLQAIPGGIEGKIVKLDIYDAPREVVRQLSMATIKKLKSAALHLSIDFKNYREAEIHTLKQGRQKSLKNLLLEFCETQVQDSERLGAIGNLFSGYFQKLEEQHEDQTTTA